MAFRYWTTYAQALPKARQIFEVMPETQLTSWYRDDLYNQQVGGHPQSQHLLGFAFDAVPQSGIDWSAFANYTRTLGFTPVIEVDHVHVQFFPAGHLEKLGIL